MTKKIKIFDISSVNPQEEGLKHWSNNRTGNRRGMGIQTALLELALPAR